MLRAYFSRVCKHLPADLPALKDAVSAIGEVVDERLNVRALRRSGREIVRVIAQAVEQNAAGKERDARRERARSWLVTDFVTLGSPLTHALYLMSHGKNDREARTAFCRNQQERQYPRCPPRLGNGENRLTYMRERRRGEPERRFHHGALFGVTRWTNLYFPMAELIWGDAIGGEIAPVFGRGC